MAEPKNPYVFRNGEWVDTRVPSEKTKENLISDTPENPKKPLPSGGKAPPGKNLISDIPENPKKPLPSGGKPTDPKKPVKPPVDKGPISDIPENPKKPLPGGGKPADPVKPPPAPPAPQQYYMTPTGPGGFIPPQQYAQNQTFETDNYSRPTPITPRAPVDKGPISDVPERPGDSINPRKPVATVNPWKNGEFIDTRVPGENGGETPIKPVDPKVPIDPKNPKTPINPPKDNPGPTPGITDVPERPGVGINERPSYGGTPKSSIPGVSDLYTAPTAPQSPMDPVKGVQAPITQKGLAAPIVPTTPNAFISGGGGANTPIVGGGGGSSSGGRNGESGGGRAGWIGGGGGGPPVVGPVNPTNPITPLPGGEKPETPKPNPTPGVTPNGLSIVPGKAGPGQINIVDWAGQVANDPTLAFRQDDPKTPENESMMMSDRVPIIDPNTPGTLLDPSDPRYQVEFDKLRQKAAQVSQTAVGTTGLASTTNATAAQAGTTNATAAQAGTAIAGQQANGGATGYNAQQTQAAVAGQDMTAAQGNVSKNAMILNAPQLDMKGSGTGVNADGSVNQTGVALNDYAKQNFSTIIDTSSPSGKALANLLGDGNYTDAKATAKGQLDILQSEFQDAQGNPKIPAWAAGVARNVSKIAAFKGMTGTAATAAMSQALMEASIPIAQADAQFFQTLTLQNLSNKQSSIINKANVLSKFDLANLDNRMAAAVENSKAFLQMDLANLDNRQQAAVINNQNRVQSILEDAKAVNTQRMFEADSQNDMDKFYGELNSNIAMYNTGQLNAMSQFNIAEKNNTSQFNANAANQMAQFNTSEKNQTSQFNANAANQASQFNSNQLNEMSQFNASEINKTNAQNMAEANAMKKFNADLENQREQYYKNMQYNIDISNANWRQSVTKDNATMQFEAAATDVKNMVGIQQEELNRVWDRSDSLLDYLWKSAESELDRKNLLTLQTLKDNAQGDREDKAGFGSIIGTLIGKAGESFFNGFNW